MRNTELAASYTKGPDLERKGPSLGATLTGLEPATSAVTGRRANQLRYGANEELTSCSFEEGENQSF